MLELLVFVNQAIYCSSLVPLVLENYRLKTARGLSDALVMLFFNSFLVLFFYFFCLRLPFFYCMSSLVQLGLTLIMIAQRFYYDDFPYKKKLAWGYWINVMVILCMIPFAVTMPLLVGHAAGWIGVVLIISTRIPQIIKIQKERSVEGFSYFFALLIGMASVFEMAIVIAYKLPLQSLATSGSAFISFLIFTWQFYQFAWKKP